MPPSSRALVSAAETSFRFFEHAKKHMYNMYVPKLDVLKVED